MSVSPRLVRKLQQVLGTESEDLVTWLAEERAHRAELTNTVRTGLDDLRNRIHGVDKSVAEVKADLMKWSFVFWVGAVLAIAALAKVLE